MVVITLSSRFNAGWAVGRVACEVARSAPKVTESELTGDGDVLNKVGESHM